MSSCHSSVGLSGVSGEKTENQLRGSFEACFAKDLDLSEFGGSWSSTAPATTSSASSQLLQIKEKELLLREFQDLEECRIQEAVQQRTELLRRRTRALWSPPVGTVLPTFPSPTTTTTPKTAQQQHHLNNLQQRGTDPMFIGTVIGSLHRDDNDGKNMNKSRASRQMEMRSKRMATKLAARQKREQQQLASSSKRKVAGKKKQRRTKH